MIREIIESGNWEKLLYYIVEEENLDPWNLDVSRLADKFIEYINSVEDIDFRIPAKVIYIAILLLKLKIETLFPKDEKVEKEIKEILELPEIDISNIEINLPVKRFAISQITLENLIDALRKAIQLKERKERKKEKFEKIKEEFKVDETNYEKVVESVYEKIKNILSKKEVMMFNELIEKNDKMDIYFKFFSVLSLEMKDKIRTYQEDFLREIYIKLNNS